MILLSKLMKLILQKLVSAVLQYGRLLFLFVLISTFFTLVLLWAKIELNLRKTTQSVRYHENLNHLQFQQVNVPFVFPTASTKKVTKSIAEIMKVIPEMNEDIIFFNSVPKSGGEFIVLLLQWLEDFNGFKHVRLSERKHRLKRYEQEKLIKEMMKTVRDGAIPFTFDSHMFFINFTSFGHQSPTYINLIRDPIDKAIANFYFHQATPKPTYGRKSFVTFNRTINLHVNSTTIKRNYAIVREFERCINDDDVRCIYKNGSLYDLTIPYFCGHEKACMMLNNKWALNKAKETVERYYNVVGILEEVNMTLTVLQHKLPYFFRDVLDVFKMQIAETNIIKPFNRPINILNRKVRKKLEKQLALEYEFYYYIKNRLLNDYAIASDELDL